jgi:uncharacterized protein (DUF1778 family)
MVKTQERGRITARVSSEIEEMLKEAAELTGMLVNQFMIQASVTHAREIIDRELFIKASKADAELMLEILSRPAQPNAALVELFAKPKEVDKNDLFNRTARQKEQTT